MPQGSAFQLAGPPLGSCSPDKGLPHRAPGLQEKTAGQSEGLEAPECSLGARPGPLGPGSSLLCDGPRIPLDVWDVLAGCLGKSYN